MLNCEGEVVWKKKSQGDTGWMVRVDANGVYHGHSSGITKYDLEGNEKWSVRTEEVLFGWHTEQYLYAGLVEPACFDGEIAKRLSRAGAKSGIIVASLMWNNRDDLDLHVYVNDEHIYYGARRSASGGELDVDANAGTITTEPVENIYWKGTPPAGKFRVVVVQYNNRTGDVKVPFEVHLKVPSTPLNIGIEPSSLVVLAGGLGGGLHITIDKLMMSLLCRRYEPRPRMNSTVLITNQVGEEKKKFEGEFTRETNATPIQGTWGGVKKSIQAFEFTYRPVNDGTAQTNETTGKLPQRAVIKSLHEYEMFFSADTISCKHIPNMRCGGEELLNGNSIPSTATTPDAKKVGGEGDLEAAGSDAKGVRLHCIKQGSKLRVRPEAGQGSYDSSMNCQFPRNIRREGARFLVDDLVVAGGSYYRVVGEIRRL
eukprot:jgi/Bigna1/67389/fgenesh1_pg.3_\